MGLDTLYFKEQAKLKWWYKLVSMPEDRYPKQLFSQEWNVDREKPGVEWRMI